MMLQFILFQNYSDVQSLLSWIDPSRVNHTFVSVDAKVIDIVFLWRSYAQTVRTLIAEH